MCGRYTLRRADLVRAAFDAVPSLDSLGPRDRYNVAPGQDVPIVRSDPDGRRVLAAARWGLVPAWTRGTPKVRPINARDDKVLTSPMFKGPMARGRCLVPADGFYEWQGPRPPKVPWFFRLADDGLFAFAGLWATWRPGPGADPVATCLHLTTGPNPLVAPVHDRMPVILHRADHARWLDPDVPPAEAAELLRPYPADRMDAHVVGTRVNRAGTEGPDLVRPAS